MYKILTVFGATGNQGGSVIAAVLQDPVLSKTFKIRAVTRDVSKPAAKELTAKGVEVVSADLSKPETLDAVLDGAHSVFLMTNFWESLSEDLEVSQGKAVADASKKAGVKHLIFSSLLNITEASGGKLRHVKHFDSKAKIEQHIRDIGVPATFYLPGAFMSNYFQIITKSDDGTYTLAVPVSIDSTRVPLIDIQSDTGKYISAILKTYPEGSGKRIYAADKLVTPKAMMEEFSRSVGQPAKAIHIDDETFKSFLPPVFAQELLETWKLMESPGYFVGADLGPDQRMLEGKTTSWSQFLAANKEKWQ